MYIITDLSVRQGLWNFVWQFSLSLEFEVIFLPHVFVATFNTSCLLYEQIHHSIKHWTGISLFKLYRKSTTIIYLQTGRPSCITLYGLCSEETWFRTWLGNLIQQLLLVLPSVLK